VRVTPEGTHLIYMSRRQGKDEPFKMTYFGLPLRQTACFQPPRVEDVTKYRSSRRNHQDATGKPPGPQFLHSKPGHDRLARTRVIREQKADRPLRQEVLVDGYPLVRQSVDEGHLGRESGACEMPER
jgi:hypothetical protein